MGVFLEAEKLENLRREDGECIGDERLSAAIALVRVTVVSHGASDYQVRV